MIGYFKLNDSVISQLADYIDKDGFADEKFSFDDGTMLPIDESCFVNAISARLYETLVLQEDTGTYDSSSIGFMYNNNFYRIIKNAIKDDSGKIVQISQSIVKCNSGENPKRFLLFGSNDFTGENEIVQYIIVNKDLNMSTGKTAAQVGHACTECAVNESLNTLFKLWYGDCQKKIVLGAHEKDLKKLAEQGIGYGIIDRGLTEIPANSLTCISLGIMFKKDAQKYIKHFQLL